MRRYATAEHVGDIAYLTFLSGQDNFQRHAIMKSRINNKVSRGTITK